MVCTDKQSETRAFSRHNTPPISHTHTPAIPVWDEVEEQAEYKYLLCLIDLQISRQNTKMMTTKRRTKFRATGEYREFLYLFIHY